MEKVPSPIAIYDSIIQIWIHMDESFWTSINVFLAIEGITLAAFYAFFKGEWRDLAVLLIGLWGIAISIMWVLVAGRRRSALILIEHQARHLEKQIFRKGIDEKKVEVFFPMYFTGAKAVFLNHKGISQPKEEYETTIETHHLASLKNGKLDLISKRSSLGIMTFLLPAIFFIIWLVILIISFIYMINPAGWEPPPIF